jgi:hypothetical protein
MSTNNRKARHTNAVLALQDQTNGHLVIVARDLEYLEDTERKARQLAIENLGTTYIPCRLYPGLCARAKTTLKFVDPDNHPGPENGEPQAPFERGEEETDN